MSQGEGKGTLRAFIALELPPDLKDSLGEVQQAMKRSGAEARWVRPQSIHLTLKFLGNIPSEMVPSIREAIETSARGTSPFEVRVAGTGAFPNERRPRVLWIGLDEPTGALMALQKKLEAALVPLGFGAERRPFKAHLTLARIKSPPRGGGIIKALESQKDVDLGKITVDKIVLCQSTLKPSGAVYKSLEEVALSKA